MRFALFLALLAAGAYWWTFRVPPGDRGVSDGIASLVADAEGSEIIMADIAPFPWTRFCVFGPYTTEPFASDSLGFRWPYRWGKIEMLDDRNFLVFVDGDDVVTAFDHTLDRGDFDTPEQTCFARDDARFTVRRDGNLTGGAPHFILRVRP